MFLFLIYKIYGYRKQDSRFLKVTTQLSLIIILSFIILSSLSGLYFGFSKSPFSFKLVFGNIVFCFVFVFFEEFIKYILSGNNRWLFFIFTVLFFLVDVFYICRNVSFFSYQFFLVFSTLIVPCFLLHLLCIYFCFYNCYIPGFIFRVFFYIYPLILPVYPNYGDYVYSVIFIVLPFILFYFSNRYIVFYYRSSISYYNKWLLVPVFSFLLFVFILVSGISRFQVLAIGSGSMEPSISYGDVVVFKKYDGFSLYTGDVVVFNYNNNLVVHRIVDIKEDVIYTKGDANMSVDSFSIGFNDIVGVVKFNVKFLGYPSVFVNEVFG